MFDDPINWETMIQIVIIWLLISLLVVIFFACVTTLREVKTPKFPVQDENTLAKVYKGLAEAHVEMPQAVLAVESIMAQGVGFYNRDPLTNEEGDE